MRRIALLLLLALVPSTFAQPGTTPEPPSDIVVLAEAANQQVHLSWYSTTLPAGTPSKYRVYVFEDGREFTNRTLENATHASFFLTNGRTYAFQVAAIKPDGTEGPRSDPVAATPRLEN
ncbi:MAG TPA: fibronectin type III domain-containing protein, partial [Candidatus Thermoplasmatota archaeon]